MNAPTQGTVYPVLPLRDIVVFPAHDRAAVRRPREERAGARRGDEGRQADPAGRPEERQPGRSRPPRTSTRIGTLGTVLQLLKLPDGTVKVLVEGGRRARDRRLHRASRVLRGRRRSTMEEAPARPPSCRRWRAPWSSEFENYVKLNKKVPPEVRRLDQPDRGAGQARRHDRRPPGAQDRREAGSCSRLELGRRSGSSASSA